MPLNHPVVAAVDVDVADVLNVEAAVLDQNQCVLLQLLFVEAEMEIDGVTGSKTKKIL
jgi:hypothetical protein